MNISSKDFMKKTLFANRSAYMPVDTLNPRINIYMPDEGKLVKMEKVRQTFTHSNNKAPNYYRPSEKDKELFAIANQYYKTIHSDQINNILKNINLIIVIKLLLCRLQVVRSSITYEH